LGGKAVEEDVTTAAGEKIMLARNWNRMSLIIPHSHWMCNYCTSQTIRRIRIFLLLRY